MNKIDPLRLNDTLSLEQRAEIIANVVTVAPDQGTRSTRWHRVYAVALQQLRQVATMPRAP